MPGDGCCTRTMCTFGVRERVIEATEQSRMVDGNLACGYALGVKAETVLSASYLRFWKVLGAGEMETTPYVV